MFIVVNLLNYILLWLTDGYVCDLMIINKE